MDKHKTIVIFRRWKDAKTLIALFPFVKSDTQGFYCSSYEHVGQHGGADYVHVIAATIPARDSIREPDVKKLFDELSSIGYRLEVRKRKGNGKREVSS